MVYILALILVAWLIAARLRNHAIGLQPKRDKAIGDYIEGGIIGVFLASAAIQILLMVMGQL